MNKNFKIQDSKESISTKFEPFLRDIRLITSPILPRYEVLCPDFGVRAHEKMYNKIINHSKKT